MRSTEMKNSFSKRTSRPARNLAEWVSFSFASVALLLVFGLIIYAGITKNDQPPVLEVDRSEAIKEIKGKYYVPFEVSNVGGETAESVQIVAELKVDSKIEEMGDFSIDFLSQNEKEKGAFVFNRDPRQAELVIRVSSYKLP